MSESIQSQGDRVQSNTLPQVTAQEINNCSISSWYDNFLSVTLKTKIIPLSDSFIDYLKEDGIFLPDDGQPQSATIEEIDSDDETTFFEDKTEIQKPDFPEVESFIRKTVHEFGAVFPKLNWSSPRDAAWITATQSLLCTSPFDVFLLLKSSDFINHDINHAFDNCSDASQSPRTYHLALRKWYDLQPSMEFRCFVKDNRLIGISQRDVNFYPFLSEIKEDIEGHIHDFFEDHVLDIFPSRKYVFDVYLKRNPHKVYLVDFNPFSTTTDSLLYDWAELNAFQVGIQEPEVRIIESQDEANRNACNAPRFATNMVPKDVIELSDGKSIAAFAEEFQRAMELNGQRNDEDSSSDEE
ncbi:cell division cycle protein [Phycomyces blakesleeanus]|uniref:Uncharacterized protein n=1 Tax=Phycomyces blakesleeanus (strain ATCC 8743b / DSM 1359 / FGSC 10004 / NBRC 33097 / NRRL 1555) TaxID=763407 RepID=A0A162ZJS1_PHYB8|nr:hypothetical protein PHYBLDRAFT_63732 [Phycomyces blakesleeanus NRRL 1555(-)]OAD67271.1 hypothetical protein PHYBLDRAFT_63732 [Phycomyces blakesleeanus NRRL 1555(-)]|eukprot:XP_018285311.1 hypothetical protein PHYBLDRAFT_63732 [Phycomyces blakesleeanus NRRL 1555(-)]